MSPDGHVPVTIGIDRAGHVLTFTLLVLVLSLSPAYAESGSAPPPTAAFVSTALHRIHPPSPSGRHLAVLRTMKDRRSRYLPNRGGRGRTPRQF